MLLFADGFEDGLAAWSFQGYPDYVTNGPGRYGNGIGVQSVGMPLTGFLPTSTVIAGCAYLPPLGGGSADIMTVLGTAGAYNGHVLLSRGAGGELIASQNTSYSHSPVLGTSALGVIPAGAWSYIELKCTISNTTGIVVVLVNGVQVLNLSGQDTQSGAVTTASALQLGYSGNTSPTGTLFDDVYICDGTGTYNNDFLGEITVEHLRPASDDTAQWVGSDGNSVNNWALVNDAGVFDGTTYVAASTPGQRDLYVPTQSIRASTAPVMGVMVSAVVEKTDAGTRTFKLDVKEGAGGTLRSTPVIGLTTTFGEFNRVFERKADGSQFTVADVNALRFGVEVVS